LPLTHTCIRSIPKYSVVWAELEGKRRLAKVDDIVLQLLDEETSLASKSSHQIKFFGSNESRVWVSPSTLTKLTNADWHKIREDKTNPVSIEARNYFLENTNCDVCKHGTAKGEISFCDDCGKAYHLSCLRISKPTTTPWYCTACQPRHVKPASALSVPSLSPSLLAKRKLPDQEHGSAGKVKMPRTGSNLGPGGSSLHKAPGSVDAIPKMLETQGRDLKCENCIIQKKPCIFDPAQGAGRCTRCSTEDATCSTGREIAEFLRSNPQEGPGPWLLTHKAAPHVPIPIPDMSFEALCGWLETGNLLQHLPFVKENLLTGSQLLDLELGYLARLEPEVAAKLLKRVAASNTPYTSKQQRSKREDPEIIQLRETLANLRRERAATQCEIISLFRQKPSTGS